MNNIITNTKMPMEEKIPSGFRVFRMITRMLIPLVFLSTGLILLYLAIPGWSLIIGIPSTLFGIVFLLYAYDEVSNKTSLDEDGG